MHRENSAADRMRPLIRAMERSIEQARAKRTHEDQPENESTSNPRNDDEVTQRQLGRHPQSTSRPSEHSKTQETRPKELDSENQPFDPTKMKARPKRRMAS